MREPRFATAEERSKVFPELYRLVEDLITEKTNEEWIALLRDEDIPYAPVNSPRTSSPIRI